KACRDCVGCFESAASPATNGCIASNKKVGRGCWIGSVVLVARLGERARNGRSEFAGCGGAIGAGEVANCELAWSRSTKGNASRRCARLAGGSKDSNSIAAFVDVLAAGRS